MSTKFDAVPVESDTTILASFKARMDPYEVLYQKWSFDGILGESIIFAAADVAALNDDELEAFARSSPMIKSETSVTITRREAFAFVNFNFVCADDE
ncbi:MAG: hypothetical protein WCP35_14965 [Verrucomicrobiota bacterium]